MVPVLFCLLSPAQAFDLGTHRALTERSVALVVEERPEVQEQLHRLVLGNRAEDLDLPTKWGRYSHYLDPTGALDHARRQPSAERVAELEQDFEAAAKRGNVAQAWRLVGHMLHHVQDMGSPPHVVPVPHNFTDGFERMDFSAAIEVADGRGLAALSPLVAQLALAEETRAAILEPGVPTWWVARPGRFGTYGPGGNDFGRSEDPAVVAAAAALAAERSAAAVAYGAALIRWSAAIVEGGAPIAVDGEPPEGPTR